MNEMKYTDVFKSMLCCLKGECEKCPCKDERNLYGGAVDCLDILLDNATRIFEEKDAEIERLNKEVDRLSQVVLYHDAFANDAIADARAEAITEFAERLGKWFSHDPAFLGVEKRLVLDVVDQIAKEMKGEENG